MTNLAIIEGAKRLNGVIEEVDTFAGWKRRGKKIKAGSKALFKTSIWKPVGGRKKDSDADYEEEINPGLILVPASFFGISQVEDMPVKE